jgi:hypothetical protein
MRRIGAAVLIVFSTFGYAEDRLNLPDPLTTANGKTVDSREVWEQERRPEILALFRTHVYGRAPVRSAELSFNVFDKDLGSLSGRAIRKQVAIRVTSGKKLLQMDLLMYLPASTEKKPVPVLALLNFHGNHTVHPDPAIAIPRKYEKKIHLPKFCSGQDDLRGGRAAGFPIEQILARGYGVATVFYADIDPDVDDGFKNGVHSLFDPPGNRAKDAWGTIGAWAWGLSRIMDYLEVDKDVDHTKVAVLGHSRLGKAALWAGAQDERFSIVISNNSGHTGACLARRSKVRKIPGCTIAKVNQHHRHWWCENYRLYNGKEDSLPVDQHMLIALIAPRPVYIASATEDSWSDPEGEFLAAVHAESVYRLFGLTGLGTKIMPEPDHALNDGQIGYHIRTGKHDLTAFDWMCYMDFADRHWGRSGGQ